jgi:radial spoke head protein 1
MTREGNIYKGYFKNGFKHGKGTYNWVDGSQYEGDWFEGKI